MLNTVGIYEESIVAFYTVLLTQGYVNKNKTWEICGKYTLIRK